MKKLLLAAALSIAALFAGPTIAQDKLGERTDYEAVAASQTLQILGTTGTQGDVLEVLVVSVATSLTSTVSIRDGAGGADIPITAANTPIGVYAVVLGARATGAGWRVTTGAGATALGVGRFR
jgi:hypothetical protein